MNIGILDIDCHADKKKRGAMIYPNLALCKISAWHKAQGDTVSWATPMEHYDILYRSKIFNFSEDDMTIYDCDKEIRGGTGYDITAKLPQEIDDMQPDLSIYPHIPADTSYGFLTRGCSRHCKWCVVPIKEGFVSPYWDVDRVANGRKNIILMDNNILAAGEYGLQQLQKIIDRGYHVDFNQALDARLVNEENAKLLAKIKWIHSRIRFGCDTKGQIAECERAIDLIVSYGYCGEFFLYTMLHGTIEECYERINYWRNKTLDFRRSKKGYAVYPYAQPYRDTQANSPPPYGKETWQGGATQEVFLYQQDSKTTSRVNQIPQWQKDLAHWANKKMLFESCDFKEFSPRKGFTCKEYFI